MIKLTIAALLLATSAHAATITALTDRPTGGAAIETLAAQFTALSGPGTAGSVWGDPSRFGDRLPTQGITDGRWNPDDPAAGYVDSNDIARAMWNLDFGGRDVMSMVFGVTDANDQARSYWNVRVDDASALIAPQIETEPGAVHWFRVAFDAPVRQARLFLSTRQNDGYSIGNASVVCR